MTNPSSKTGDRPEVETIGDMLFSGCVGNGFRVFAAQEATAFMDAQAAEIEKLTGELQDFEGILSEGTCVNDKTHKRYLGCLYCRAEAAESSLVERVKKLIEAARAVIDCDAGGNQNDWVSAMNELERLAPAEEKKA